MLSRRLHSLPLLCVLLLCLLTSPARSFGYVWCLSADGHAELETAVAGDCARTPAIPAAAGPPALTLVGETDDCGPCLDISPALQWTSTRSRDDAAGSVLPMPPAAVAGVAPDHLHRQLLTNGLVPDPPPRLSELILQHRTVVLLI